MRVPPAKQRVFVRKLGRTARTICGVKHHLCSPQAYLEKYGSDTRNKLGKVVNEQIRLVAFDLIAELEDAKEGGDLDPKFITEVIFKVSRGLKELEQAEKLNAEREDEIKALVVKETAEKVETACRKKGVTQEAKEAILAEIFSITEKA